MATGTNDCCLTVEADFNQVALACLSVSNSWDKLAVHLNIDRNTVLSIRKGERDTVWCLNELLTAWLRQPSPNHPKPSWRILCDAVSNIDRPLSEKIWTDHTSGCSLCNQHHESNHESDDMELSSGSEASPVVYKSVDEFYTEAVNLRDRFQELLEKLNQPLKDVDNDRLKLKLNWHLTCERENTPEVNEILTKIENFDSPLKVLNCLIRSNLIGYLNYRLLDVFQGLINDKEVDGMITKYEEAHEIFLKSSDLETLAQLFLDHPTLAPEIFAGLPRFTVRLNKEWEKKSAYQWSQLLKTRFNQWPPHIHIVMITKKCIIIEYSVRPCNATDIVRDLSDSQVLSTHGVTEIELSEQLREMGRNDQFDRQPLPLDDFQPHSLSDEKLISIPSEDSKELITDQSTSATEHTHSDEEELEEKNNSLLEAVKHGSDTETVSTLLKEGADIHTTDWDGYTPLHHAAKNGRTETVKLLLKEGATKDINRKNRWGDTPLHCAAENGHDSIIEILIQYGATVDEKDKFGKTPLHLAASWGRKTTVELLLKYKANYSIQSKYGDTMLHSAAEGGNTEIVELFLKLCGTSDLHKVDSNGYTPLHCAVSRGHLEIVELLLKSGANVDGMKEYCSTPLHIAADRNHVDIAELLLKAGANVHSKDNRDGRTPLHHAAQKGHERIVELLLKYGAIINEKDKDGYTPLHHAAENGRTETVKLLLKEGTAKDINTKNKFGDTPLHLAAQHRHDSIIEILIQYGATVDEKDKYGYTLLHTAARRGRKTTVELLLKYKANYSIRSRYGYTMLHSAAIGGNPEVVELFLELCGTSDLQKVDSNDYTLLHCAVENGHIETVELLLKSGSNVDGMKECFLTPLHLAVDISRVDIAELLLKAGANVHSKDGDGLTPLDHAKEQKDRKIVQLLLHPEAVQSSKLQTKVQQSMRSKVTTQSSTILEEDELEIMSLQPSEFTGEKTNIEAQSTSLFTQEFTQKTSRSSEDNARRSKCQVM